MILVHNDDGKHKWQSHEVRLEEDNNFYNAEFDVYSHDLSSLVGYGETKEEAVEDFKKKFSYIMQEMESLETLLFTTDIMISSI